MIKREASHVGMQQYPSPSAEGHENGPFYNTNPGRDADRESSAQEEGTDEQPDAVDLQLAAQITQGLAQNLASSQNQDPSLQSLISQQQGAPVHHDPVSASHFVQVAPAQPSPLPPHVGMEHQPHYSPVDATPSRKRSKVSRACDECRRKKVKCDAQSELGQEACSNCRRPGVACLFSRIPQKRGPSKGYIKELADRIQIIERGLHGDPLSGDGTEEGSRRASLDMYAGSVLEESRKRPYSALSGEHSTPAPVRQVAWGSEPKPSQLQNSDRQRPAYNAESLAAEPVAPRGFATNPARPATATDSAPSGKREQVKDIDDGVFQAYLNIIAPVFPFLANTNAKVQDLLSKVPLFLQSVFIEALYATMGSFNALPNPNMGDSRLAHKKLLDWELEPSTEPPSKAESLVQLQTLLLLSVDADNSGPSSLTGGRGGPSKSATLSRAVALAYSSELYKDKPNTDADADPDSEENLAVRAWWSLVMMDRWNALGTAKAVFIPRETAVLNVSLKKVLGDVSYELLQLSDIIAVMVSSVISLVDERYLSHDAEAFDAFMGIYAAQVPLELTSQTHPLVFLAYWHCRTLAYLLTPSVSYRNVLRTTGESVSLLLANPQLVTPLTHHFSTLAIWCLLELAKQEQSREVASQQIHELIKSNIAPSPWDEDIRNKMVDSTVPAHGSVEATASQSLQHLADLATAGSADLSATAVAAVTAAIAASEKSTKKAAEEAIFPTIFPAVARYESLGFNPLPVLRRGYLKAF